MVEAAKRDLSTRTGTPVDAIEVVRVEEMEWSDAALGCPQPGQMYAQVIVPGYRIILRAAGTSYQYHTDMDSQVILCQNP
ncbi:MAG TPA: hypothetical protein VMP10_00420 [Chloroflexota bacterium]|nr:hypothetical protein [Chloroflexota bacterium]